MNIVPLLSRTLLFIYFIYNSLYMLILKLLFVFCLGLLILQVLNTFDPISYFLILSNHSIDSFKHSIHMPRNYWLSNPCTLHKIETLKLGWFTRKVQLHLNQFQFSKLFIKTQDETFYALWLGCIFLQTNFWCSAVRNKTFIIEIRRNIV